jgi:monofunctional biosynthetic peptidoglycan transglycosylase
MRRAVRVVTAIAAVGFGYIAYIYLTLPDVRELRTRNLASTAFMDLRAREARAAGREPKRVHRWVPYRRISPHLKRAVLVAEDAGFWGHEGIDLVEIKKSLETDWESGSLTRGASTITQQLAKNLYLSPSRNPLRKLRELFITRRLEHELSKTRIFELYLNNIEWGDGIWGAEAAAQTYFRIPASAVGADQAALMAGAIVNPRVLNIASPNGRLRARQRIIRARMGYVTPPPIIAIPPPAGTPEAPEPEMESVPDIEPIADEVPPPDSETAPPAPSDPEAAPAGTPDAPDSAPDAPKPQPFPGANQ